MIKLLILSVLGSTVFGVRFYSYEDLDKDDFLEFISLDSKKGFEMDENSDEGSMTTELCIDKGSGEWSTHSSTFHPTTIDSSTIHPTTVPSSSTFPWSTHKPEVSVQKLGTSKF